MIRDRTQRALDIVLSIILLIVFFPALLLVALLIRFKMGSPIFFIQARAGKSSKSFPLFKFRTMQVETPTNRQLTPEQRVTPLGQQLRRLSLDELPQLWNVLRGDLSLVGPRPLPLIYLNRYSPDQARRHEVLPGITGWAQINGRNAISWEEKFKLDVWYVTHRSLFLYFKILMLTGIKVLFRDGIMANDSTNMPEFMGSH